MAAPAGDRRSPVVLIAQNVVKQYRVPFFDQLHDALANHGMTLRVAYGQPTAEEQAKGDNVDLSPTYGIALRNHWLLGGRMLYQPLLPLAAKADLVVVEQANRYLANYALLARSAAGRGLVAYWGHGWKRQPGSLVSAYLKRRQLRLPDWWFAYTATTAQYLAAAGVDPARITDVQNSVDTQAFRALLRQLDPEQVRAFRQRLGVGAQSPVGLYCGSLYVHKKLECLCRAAAEIRRLCPDFHLLVVGDGPQRTALQAFARNRPWVHCLGARFGCDKAICYRAADVVLNPGLVGLGILDAFVAGLPFLTTDIPIHSPEIDYLRPGYNGVITEPDPVVFAAAAAALLNDDARRARLSQGALASAEQYSMANMVDRFVTGIRGCLAAGGRSAALTVRD